MYHYMVSCVDGQNGQNPIHCDWIPGRLIRWRYLAPLGFTHCVPHENRVLFPNHWPNWADDHLSKLLDVALTAPSLKRSCIDMT